MTDEELRKQAEANIKDIAQKQAEETAQAIIDEMMKAKNEELAKQFNSKEDAEKARKEFADEMQKLSAEIKKSGQVRKKEEKPTLFTDVIKNALKENAEAIASFKKGSPELTMSIKAVGDMSLENNFPNHTPFTQDVRQGLIQTPYNRVWLSDLLPTGTSTGSSILFPKENGGEGGADVWTDKDQEKAQMDFDFTSQSAHFKWIAGFVVVDREMLDDIDWLGSYLGQKMLTSLRIAENNFIMNGTTDSNPVQGLKPATKNYNGAFTNAPDRVIDAVYGQIPEDTHQWYLGNNILLSPRATVGLGLNKADGSGEYDLPTNSIAFGNGSLSIGGVRTTSTTGISNDEFIAFDSSALMYVRRMSPELRMFEDSELAKKNKVMFRVEQRSTLVTFNDDAIVYGDLKGTVVGGE